MASEIRVDKINSLSGVGTVTLSPTGVDIAGITTVATLKATTGIVTTLTATTGIATNFTADKISLPNSTNGSLNIGVSSAFKINHNGTDSFITEVGGGDLYIQGSDIILRDAGTLDKHIEMTQNGAVDIYHDNSKKFETTSAGVSVTGSATVSGDIKTTAATVNIKSGSSINTNSDTSAHGALHKNTNSGQFAVVSGGTGGNNYLSFFTSASAAPTEKMRIDSSGRVGINTATPSNANAGFDDLVVRGATAGNAGITVLSGTTSAQGTVAFADGTNGTEPYAGYVQYSHSTNKLILGAGAADQVQIEDGNVTLNDCDLVMSSGRGMSFAATGGPTNGSGTSELFDDYEEGTFAPYYSGDSGGGNYAYSRQAGIYTKIGNTVYYSFYITTNVVNANASGNLIITGLPYTSGSNNEHYQAASIGYYASWNNTYPSHALCDVNNTRIYIYKTHANTHIQHAVPTDVTNGTSLIVSGHYHVA